ncbi:MAG: DUF3667 domain-containing protein [Prevotella sp.]|nr:DUF3667 domain-containing protein [Prevotella sp.]
MSIKSLFARFRAWQRQPFSYGKVSSDVHHCLNCGYDYTGNYCSRCGQEADTRRLDWHVIGDGLLDVFDVEKRSLPLTIWYLLFRPGYLISDYLDGRRRNCYSPVMLIFILSIVFTFVDKMNSAGSTAEVQQEVTTVTDAFSHLGNVAWYFLINSLFLIPPTWILFRHAPRHTRHTLSEDFFIQMFIGSQMILLNMLVFILPFNIILALLLLLFLFSYAPVFGYGIWGTVWRSAACMFAAVVVPQAIMICIDWAMGNMVIDAFARERLLMAVGAIMAVVVGYFIGQHTERRRLAP